MRRARTHLGLCFNSKEIPMPTPKYLPLVLGGLSLLSASALSPAIAAETHRFSIAIENISQPTTLRLPDGSTKAVPVAPGAYAIVNASNVIFEGLAPARGNGLETLAEDGMSGPLVETLRSLPGVRAAGTFRPGESFTVMAQPGDRLVFAAMFAESNDLFFGPGPLGIALFDAAGRAVAGDVTEQVRLWDAGTEVNEVPGAGPNQAPRQAARNTGPTEHGVVRPVDDGFVYPAVSEVLKVRIGGE
jgi:hypothetical protein